MLKVVAFMKQVAVGLQMEGNFGTAHVYRSSLNAIIAYHGKRDFAFDEVTPEWLKGFEIHLRGRGCSWNTVSTYLRTFRAVYNRAVDGRMASYVPNLFRSVYTGTRADHKRALCDEDMKKVFAGVSSSSVVPAGMRRSQELFILMFLLRGLPFVDLAYLEKSNLEGNMLKYNRAKTGIPMNVEILDSAATIISQLRNKHTTVLPEHPDYLFYILSGKNKRSDEAGYKEYQSALRCFNNDLKSLARKLCIRSSVTSYTFRHSWATTAKYRGVSIEMISELLGHKSIKTTQIYLKGFELRERTEVNRMNLYYVRSAPNSRV